MSRAAAVVATAGILVGTLSACGGGDDEGDPAASAQGEQAKSRWESESPSRAQLKRLLLSGDDLSQPLRERYPQIFALEDGGGGSKVASKRPCQPVADALPATLGKTRVLAKQRYSEAPDEFVDVGLASYGSAKEAAAAMRAVDSAVDACASPFRIGTKEAGDDPYKGVERKTAPREGDQAVAYNLRSVSYADGHEYPNIHVHVRVGTVVASFTRLDVDSIDADLIKAQVARVRTG